MTYARRRVSSCAPNPAPTASTERGPAGPFASVGMPPDPTRRPPTRAGRLPVAPLVIVLLTVTAISVVLSLRFGSERLSTTQVTQVLLAHLTDGSPDEVVSDTIVWQLRLPRAILAAVVGAGLALSGAGMQTLVRNPLADPYLLGISSGAAVGATLVITVGAFATFGGNALTVGALVGAVCAATAVYLVSLGQGGITPLRLVLSGVVLSSAFSATASFLVFISDDKSAAGSVLFWMLGALGGAKWSLLVLPALAVAFVGLAMMLGHGWLDALASGEETALALGVPVPALRTALFLGLSLLVGVLVSVSGGIGFVGLILPHVARLLVGSTHRRMLPVAAVAGSLFLVWVDVAARQIAAPQEMPLGVVTGMVGAPIFLVLMGRRRYRFGNAS